MGSAGNDEFRPFINKNMRVRIFLGKAVRTIAAQYRRVGAAAGIGEHIETRFDDCPADPERLQLMHIGI